jgi:hypothetical protein
MKEGNMSDTTIQKILTYLEDAKALDLGSSPWVTYDEDETVSSFDFEKFLGHGPDSKYRLDIPHEFHKEIEEALGRELDQIVEPSRSLVGGPGSASPAQWDTCAWYQPLHFFGSDWGIFIREECAFRLAIEIAKHTNALGFKSERGNAIARQSAGKQVPSYWNLSNAEIFLRAAIIVLFLHEHYHHRIECLGIRLHVITQSPLYGAYSKTVYKPALGTDDLLEEALANASMYLRLAEGTYQKLMPASVREGLRRKLRTSFPYDPPGYRKAILYLDQGKFNAGENILQGYVRETSTKPVQPDWHWENAPRMTQSFLNIKSNIYTVVPRGQRAVLSPNVMPLSCSKDQLVRLCKRMGYEVLHNRGAGSHTVMSKAGSAGIVTIPDRKDVSIGVIKNTLVTIGGYKLRDLPKLLAG